LIFRFGGGVMGRTDIREGGKKERRERESVEAFKKP
jgi:hypothetical protein